MLERWLLIHLIIRFRTHSLVKKNPLGSSREAASCYSLPKGFHSSYRASPPPFPRHHRSFLCSCCVILPNACFSLELESSTTFEPGHLPPESRCNRCSAKTREPDTERVGKTFPKGISYSSATFVYSFDGQICHLGY